MKKLTGFIALAVFAAACFVTPVAAATTYEDVPSNAWYREYVYELTDKDILTGKGKNRFDPNAAITRAEFAKVLAAAAGIKPEAVKGSTGFKDVKDSAWYAPYVKWAAEQGIVNGVGDGRFAPDDNISREEIVVMIARYANKVSSYSFPQHHEVVQFRDTHRVSEWAKTAVAALQQAGIMGGYENKTFLPLANATRAETSKIVAIYLRMEADSDYTPEATQYLPESEWKSKPQYSKFNREIYGISVRGVVINSYTMTAGAIMANDRISSSETMASMVEKSGAAIAVNGTYFDAYSKEGNYQPWDTLVIDGEVVRINNPRPVFGADAAGEPFIGVLKIGLTLSYAGADGETMTLKVPNGLNREPYEGEALIYTSYWGSTLGFNAAAAIAVDGDGKIVEVVYESDIALPEGGFVYAMSGFATDRWELLQTCKIGDALRWDASIEGTPTGSVATAVGGGPTIVKGGKAYTNYSGEGFYYADVLKGNASRSCIGVRADGFVVIVMTYCTLQELTDIMIHLGCVDAMNLDGGGSSGLYVNGTYMRTPGRKLNNMLYFK